MESNKILENIVSNLKFLESERKRIGEKIKSINEIERKDCLENKIVIPIEGKNVTGEIAGIDGGIVKKSFHGIDLILLRAVGVVYFYRDNELKKVTYYPEAIVEPEAKLVTEPYTEMEFELVSNIERQIKEINTAREVIEKFEPDFIFLDGSIVPQYVYGQKGSLIFSRYIELINTYKSLFDSVKSRKTILAGVIEDSRGIRFCEITSSLLNKGDRLILEKSRDTNLLEYILNKGERTTVFTYSSLPVIHPVLKEFPNEKIYSFYLRTAEFDQPMRVDFLGDKGVVADEISSVLLQLTSSEVYSIPSVLIEADQRAKLSETDLITFYNDLVDRLGVLSALREKRRNRRPF